MTALAKVGYVSFVVPGRPVPQGGMRAFAKGNKAFISHSRPKEIGDYRARVALAAQAADVSPLAGPIELEASFFLPRPKNHFGTGKNERVLKASAPRYPISRPDVDKCERALLDALSGICFHDDAQVVVMRSMKHYCEEDEGPRTTVSLWDLS